MVDMSIFQPTDEFLKIQQLAPFCGAGTACYNPSGHIFLGKANFCTNGHAQLFPLCHEIQSDMLTIFVSPAHLFTAFNLSIPALQQLWRLCQL